MDTSSLRPTEKLALKERLSSVAAAVGLLGSVACSVAMLAALVGLLGAGVAASAASTSDMAGMNGTTRSPAPASHNSSLPSPLVSAVFFLVQSGPAILIFSIAAIALAVGFRRRVALAPLVVGGLVLYWGMYMQADRLVMYFSIGIGLAVLIGAYIWSARANRGLEARPFAQP